LDYFAHQIAYFSHDYRVIAVDTRGHGQSPRGEDPFTLEQFAEDLRDFMDGLKIKKAHLLGFSDGGNIALTFALWYPERVRSLILNGANLYPQGVKRSVQIPIEIGYRVAKFFARRSAGAKQKAEQLGLMVNEPNIPPEALSRLTMPTLVIAGDRDMIKDEHTCMIASYLPNGQLEILQGDHFIANRNPVAFNDAVERFLKEVG
jgi:pimeloyl-ACP methyl ester carboxylesterase